MNVNTAIFRAYDIRGKIGETLTGEVADQIGKAFGTYIKRAGGYRVSIAHDSRRPSKELAKHFIDGVLSTGINVIDLGRTTTPMLYFSIIKMELDGGAIITASHNAPDYSGIKLCQKNALHIFGGELTTLRRLIEGGSFSTGDGRLEKRNIFPDYETEILRRVRLERSVKINLSGEGEIFVRLGCQLVDKDGAEVSISFDPDGDRLKVEDEGGQPLPTEKIAALLAKHIIRETPDPSVKFVYDVKSLLGFKEMVEKYGGRTEMLPTGRSFFRQKLFEDPKVSLGVEASGHIHINDNFFGFDDAIFAAARLLEIMAKTKKTLSALLSDFPPSFYTPMLEPFCPDERKFAIVEEVKKELSKNYDTIDIDGVKFFLDKKSWGLIRASNTGPHLSLRFEADRREKVLEMIKITANLLLKYPEVQQNWMVGAYE